MTRTRLVNGNHNSVDSVCVHICVSHDLVLITVYCCTWWWWCTVTGMVKVNGNHSEACMTIICTHGAT